MEGLSIFRAMDIKSLIAEIRLSLTENFNEVDRWFDTADAIRHFRPANGGWTISQVLEHIALTNHFLLILVDKGANKAIRRAETENLSETLSDYTFHHDRLTEVGMHQSFAWIRPEHMEPKGEKSLDEVRAQLKMQLQHCCVVLDQLKNGEGVLYKTTMTVNDLGKIDVYEYLYFISQHARRHITQMEKNRSAFQEKNESTYIE